MTGQTRFNVDQKSTSQASAPVRRLSYDDARIVGWQHPSDEPKMTSPNKNAYFYKLEILLALPVSSRLDCERPPIVDFHTSLVLRHNPVRTGSDLRICETEGEKKVGNGYSFFHSRESQGCNFQTYSPRTHSGITPSDLDLSVLRYS